MFYIDIIIAIIIGAIILNLYLFRFEYNKNVIAVWSKWSKIIFNMSQAKRKLPKHEFCNDKETEKTNTIIKNEVHDTNNIDTGNSSIRFNQPKAIYKNSFRVKKDTHPTQPNYHFCAICGKIKIKDKSQ